MTRTEFLSPLLSVSFVAFFGGALLVKALGVVGPGLVVSALLLGHPGYLATALAGFGPVAGGGITDSAFQKS